MTAGGQCWELPTLGRRTSETGFGLWPTPTVCGNYNRKGLSDKSGDGLATAVMKCATPTARDWKSGKASDVTMERNSRPLSEQIGGSLNPTWVEWLMGWPLGWTDLKPLATDKSPCAQPQHGTS
jgi:DNA (cytosine-5)-methyltransferase 1